MRRALYILTIFLNLAGSPAHAVTDEAAAVIRQCGIPPAENIANSDVTNRLQRDLIYGDVTMHFVPNGSGWTFTTAWNDHFPATRSQLEASMPCFKAALSEAPMQPLEIADPAIAQQVANPASISASVWGIPHLGLILLLLIATLIVAFRPRRNLSPVHEHPIPRRLRRPGLPIRMFRNRNRRPSL